MYIAGVELTKAVGTYTSLTWTDGTFVQTMIDTEGTVVDLANNQFVMPAGAESVEFYVATEMNAQVPNYQYISRMVDQFGAVGFGALSNSGGNPQKTLSTGEIPCRAGDTFKFQAMTLSGVDSSLTDYSWVCAKIGTGKLGGLTMSRSIAHTNINQTLLANANIAWHVADVNELSVTNFGGGLKTFTYPAGYNYLQQMAFLQGTHNAVPFGITCTFPNITAERYGQAINADPDSTDPIAGIIGAVVDGSVYAGLATPVKSDALQNIAAGSVVRIYGWK